MNYNGTDQAHVDDMVTISTNLKALEEASEELDNTAQESIKKKRNM
jgi:hypothetical protein